MVRYQINDKEMKAIGLIILLTVCIAAKGQVPSVIVKDSTLLKAVNIFLDSVESLKIRDEVIVLIVIKKLDLKMIQSPVEDPLRGMMYQVRDELTYELSLSVNNSLYDFKELVTPSFFFDLRSKKCFVTFSAENLFELNDKSRDGILKQAGKYVKPVLGSSVLAGMTIEVHGEQLKIGPFGHGYSRKGK